MPWEPENKWGRGGGEGRVEKKSKRRREGEREGEREGASKEGEGKQKANFNRPISINKGNGKTDLRLKPLLKFLDDCFGGRFPLAETKREVKMLNWKEEEEEKKNNSSQRGLRNHSKRWIPPVKLNLITSEKIVMQIKKKKKKRLTRKVQPRTNLNFNLI